MSYADPSCARCSISRASRPGATVGPRATRRSKRAVDTLRLLRRAGQCHCPRLSTLRIWGSIAARHLLIERALGDAARRRAADGARPRSGPADPPARVGARARARRCSDGRTIARARAAPTATAGSAPNARAARAPATSSIGPAPTWGLAARGALVEAGGPTSTSTWKTSDLVWADLAPRLYAQAAASQWDPADGHRLGRAASSCRRRSRPRSSR